MTLEELLAREEIKQLRLGYATYLDRHDFAALADLFTEDAVCEFGEQYGGDWVGRDVIRANYEREMAKVGTFYDSMHVVTNPWIEFTGPDSAQARWYLIDLITRQQDKAEITTRGGHDNPLLYLAFYEDQCRREGNRWRIARTRLHFLWPDRMLDDSTIQRSIR